MILGGSHARCAMVPAALPTMLRMADFVIRRSLTSGQTREHPQRRRDCVWLAAISWRGSGRSSRRLIASRQGRSVPELADMVECHTRTVYRDLEALQAAGFPVTTERDGPPHGLVAPRPGPAHPAHPLEPAGADWRSISAGAWWARSKGTVFHDALESLCAKIKALLPADMIRAPGARPGGANGGSAPGKPHAPTAA